MGAGASRRKQEDAEKLPRLYPEPDYVVKTRAPMPSIVSRLIFKYLS